MSREKLSWVCTATAWLPTMAALATSALARAASTPSTMAPSSQGACLSWRESMRAMWRCDTWLNSCASTLATSCGVSVTASSPRCTPR
ncbi:hypothetical protein FQZ97_913260 [compost metagenome]